MFKKFLAFFTRERPAINPEIKFCINCKNSRKDSYAWVCKLFHTDPDPVTGQVTRYQCSSCRDSDSFCGLDAKYFEKKGIL